MVALRGCRTPPPTHTYSQNAWPSWGGERRGLGRRCSVRSGKPLLHQTMNSWLEESIWPTAWRKTERTRKRPTSPRKTRSKKWSRTWWVFSDRKPKCWRYTGPKSQTLHPFQSLENSMIAATHTLQHTMWHHRAHLSLPLLLHAGRRQGKPQLHIHWLVRSTVGVCVSQWTAFILKWTEFSTF